MKAIQVSYTVDRAALEARPGEVGRELLEEYLVKSCARLGLKESSAMALSRKHGEAMGARLLEVEASISEDRVSAMLAGVLVESSRVKPRSGAEAVLMAPRCSERREGGDE